MPDAMREFSSCHFVPMRQYLRTTVKAKRFALDVATLCKVEHAQTITRRVVPMQILAVRFGVTVPTMHASISIEKLSMRTTNIAASVTRDSKMHELTTRPDFVVH